ncbi:hypothetical protein [Psychromonas aquatilis]|uniref:Uracil DNA glycosylase superfamily protein n=1 Tax=Psychromonas aquatilis TaxID=2005072 RepID=A0ABU9GSL5_9GAMM
MFEKDSYLLETNKHKEEYMRTFPLSKGFAIDGPNDSDAWSKADKRILFMLKETYGVKGDICQCMDSLEYNKSNFYSNKTNQNIAKLAYGIMTGKPSAGLSSKKLSPFYSSSSTIEIKKSTGKKKSNDKEILKHALFSEEFIKWQIDKLNPDIIICCGSIVHSFLVNNIYSTKVTDDITKIGDIVIIKSKHPSAPGYKVDNVVSDIKKFLMNN